MSVEHVWHGRRGTVLLGPTENRVARWLADMTVHGRITLRTVDLIAAVHVERSEAYRITRNLRNLGLFGVENDRGGNHKGRRYWRTVIEHDGANLDPVKHRQAWSRIRAWARARQASVKQRLAELRGDHTSSARPAARSIAEPTPAGVVLGMGPTPAGVTFAEAMRQNGLGSLLDAWGVQ